MRTLSPLGMQKLHSREGLRLRPYHDSQGHCTVGWGHLIHRGRCTPEDYQRWTLPDKAAADALFAQDVVPYERAVDESVKVPLADHQFDALVSMTYNIGTAGFRGSTVVKRLNAGNFKGVPDAMMMWTKNPELKGRRESEVAQFLNPYDRPQPEVTQVTRVTSPSVTLQRGPSTKFGRAEWLHPVFRIRLEALHDEVPFTVTSGGRSTKRQRELYNLFLAKKGNPANRPGTSWHEYDPESDDPWTLAQAADIEPIRGKTRADLHRASGDHGLHFPISGEPWHIQPVEAKSSKRTRGQGLGPIPAHQTRREIDMFIGSVNGHACLFEGEGLVFHLDEQEDVDALKVAGIPEVRRKDGKSLGKDFTDSHLIIMNADEGKAYWRKRLDSGA